MLFTVALYTVQEGVHLGFVHCSRKCSPWLCALFKKVFTVSLYTVQEGVHRGVVHCSRKCSPWRCTLFKKVFTVALCTVFLVDDHIRDFTLLGIIHSVFLRCLMRILVRTP